MVVTFGRKGSGKSYSTKQRLRAVRGRICVWDFMAEYAGPTADRPLPRARLYQSLRKLAVDSAAGKLPERVVVQAPRDQFELWCRWALRAGPRTLVIDEVNLYCSASHASPALLELLRIGRHSCLDIFFAARRPAEVHRDLTAQADELVFFRTTEPRDLAWIAAYTSPEFAERLKTLPKYRSASWIGDSAETNSNEGNQHELDAENGPDRNRRGRDRQQDRTPGRPDRLTKKRRRAKRATSRDSKGRFRKKR